MQPASARRRLAVALTAVRILIPTASGLPTWHGDDEVAGLHRAPTLVKATTAFDAPH